MDAGGPFNFPSDFHVPVKVYRRNAPWEQAHLDWVTGNFTHAFIEAGKPLFGDLLMLDVFKEHDALTAKGVVTGMIAHGSELRSPERHAEQYPWSPYRDKDWNDLDAIRRKVHDSLQSSRPTRAESSYLRQILSRTGETHRGSRSPWTR